MAKLGRKKKIKDPEEEKFYAIECMVRAGFGEVMIHGPYTSIKELKADIVDDSEISNLKDQDLEIGDNDDWGNDFIIVKELETVRPVPEVSVGIDLRTVTDGHSTDD